MKSTFFFLTFSPPATFFQALLNLNSPPCILGKFHYFPDALSFFNPVHILSKTLLSPWTQLSDSPRNIDLKEAVSFSLLPHNGFVLFSSSDTKRRQIDQESISCLPGHHRISWCTSACLQNCLFGRLNNVQIMFPHESKVTVFRYLAKTAKCTTY